MPEVIPNWHPIFVHFTITLLTFAGVVQCIIWVKRPRENSPLWLAQKWISALGILAVISTVLTGYHAYSTVAHDAVSHAAMSNHRNWALVTSAVFTSGAALSLLLARKYLLFTGALLVLSWGLATVTGYKGGELVYRYGLGVLSLPNTDSSEHQHDGDHSSEGHAHDRQSDIMLSNESKPHPQKGDIPNDQAHQAETGGMNTEELGDDENKPVAGEESQKLELDKPIVEEKAHHHDDGDNHHH